MKRQKPEQIVALLHQFDAALGQGKTIEDICREQGISPATYHRWKQKYGGLSIQDAKRLKELELENAKLKRLLAESMLANDALREFLSKKA
jgi:putative transposase